MRVLFIHNRYKHFGGEDVAVEMEQALLRSKGHAAETLLFDNDEIGGLVSKIKTGINAIYNRKSAGLLRKKIREFKPDLIHVHNLFFVASPAILSEAQKLGVPVIQTLHNYRLICANALLLRENKVCERCITKTYPLDGIRFKCYRNSAKDSALATAVTSIHKSIGTWRNKVDRYIVLTEFAKKKFLGSSLNVTPDKMVIKPNFVYDPGEGKNNRKDQYLYVGRLSVEKGVRIALSAFAAMGNLNLVLAGDGPDADALKQEFQQYKNIRFAGKQDKDEVLALLKESKALIFPSIWYEGLPFTIIEAYSTGTPVIASKIGAMEYLIEDGYNGYHFRTGDPDDLSQKVMAFENDIHQSELYTNARKSYEQHYHPEIHYQSVISIYSGVIKKHLN